MAQFCSGCGQKCGDAAAFCMYCGTKVLQGQPAGRPGDMSFWQAFKSFDKDGNGRLTADEVVGVLTREGGGAPMSVQEARMFVAYFDLNGDGVLDANEFCAAMGQPLVFNGNNLGSWTLEGGGISAGPPPGAFNDENVEMAVPMATPITDMGSTTNTVTNISSTTHNTGHNITGNMGPVNVVAGNMSVQHAAKSEAEIAMERHNADEERRIARLRIEADIQREMQERADAELARRRRKERNAVGMGATIGFFCGGPLGAAIGAKIASDQAAKQVNRGL